jgi:hypothetical protein
MLPVRRPFVVGKLFGMDDVLRYSLKMATKQILSYILHRTCRIVSWDWHDMVVAYISNQSNIPTDLPQQRLINIYANTVPNYTPYIRSTRLKHLDEHSTTLKATVCKTI